MTQAERVLLARGAGTVKTIQFWRLAWEALERDTRDRRYLFAPLDKRGMQVFVARADEFRDVVMRGPQADYMQSASWRGETRWAEDDTLPGGSYLLDWRPTAHGSALPRFRSFIRRRVEVVREWGPEVDVIDMGTTGAEPIRRTLTSLLFV